MNERFNNFSKRASNITGRSYVFIGAISVIVLWLLSGPLLHFSDTWQLIINTLTTLITFLMVFLIQNSQNRDSSAIHLKLDELINATAKASNRIIDAERLTDTQLEELQSQTVSKRRPPAKKRPKK